MTFFDTDWMTIGLALLLVISHCLCLFLGWFFAKIKARNEAYKEKENPVLAALPECSVRCDPTYCDTWCKAKERFSRDHTAKNTPDAYKDCKHERTYTRVIESVVTCEVTVITCLDCCTDLTEPKTEL